MKFKRIIIDADFCIKVGASQKYRYLERLLPELAEKAYIHRIVYDEIMVPACAKEQVNMLVQQKVLEIVDENNLEVTENIVYQGAYEALARVMINSRKPKKNQGETHSLAMAKAKSIPYFVTDEMKLQPIVDRILNSGTGEDILCVRIEDVILMMKSGSLEGFKRKEAKVLWRLAGKSTEIFDRDIWRV